MNRRVFVLMLGVAASFVAGCGGKSTPTEPTVPPAATITIGIGTGVSPKSVTVPRGSQVLFVNNDSISHQVTSNPHPEHTDCPEINAVGFLGKGQSRQTGNLNTARTCGFHDHDRPDDKLMQGTIVIQ